MRVCVWLINNWSKCWAKIHLLGFPGMNLLRQKRYEFGVKVLGTPVLGGRASRPATSATKWLPCIKSQKRPSQVAWSCLVYLAIGQTVHSCSFHQQSNHMKAAFVHVFLDIWRFPEIGLPLVIHFSGIFHKPTSYWDTMTMEPPNLAPRAPRIHAFCQGSAASALRMPWNKAKAEAGESRKPRQGRWGRSNPHVGEISINNGYIYIIYISWLLTYIYIYIYIYIILCMQWNF